MKTKYLFIVLLTFYFPALGQDLYQLEFDSYQDVQEYEGAPPTLVKFPYDSLTLVMGGLNDWDGMNNYFNVFGSKLIISSSARGKAGIQNIVLMREDGNNILNIFPKLKARLTPLSQVSTQNAVDEATLPE